MNGIESVIQAGQPPRAASANVPKPLQDLMGLVNYLMSQKQGGGSPTPSVAEGIAAAAAQNMAPDMGAADEGMSEPDLQDVRDTALPAMRQEEMQDQQAMQQMAQQIQQQNRPQGITSLEPDIVPLRAGGILGYDDDELGFAPGGLTPEFAGAEGVAYSEPPSNEPRVEAYGPGGKKGMFTAAELRQMGYPEEEIKRRFASQAPAAPSAPAAAAPAPAAPMKITRVPNAPGAAKPTTPAMPAAEPPDVNPYAKYVDDALKRQFDQQAPTQTGINADMDAALKAAGITGPAGQKLESGIKQLQEMYNKQAMTHEEEKKGRAMRGLQEFLLAGARGGKAWQNLANAGRGGLAYEDRMKAQDAAFNKLRNEQQAIIIKMESTIEEARRAEAMNRFDLYQKKMDEYQRLRKAFDNNQMQLAGQAFQVAEQAATRREATTARKEIANQQAQLRAALAANKGIGGIKPPSMRDELALRQDVNSKFFTGAVTPEMRAYLNRSEDGKRVLNDIANGRIKYDPRTGWGAAESAINRAAEMYKRDILGSTGRDSGITSVEQAMRELGGAQ
jgi:hypothetical protein